MNEEEKWLLVEISYLRKQNQLLTVEINNLKKYIDDLKIFGAAGEAYQINLLETPDKNG